MEGGVVDQIREGTEAGRHMDNAEKDALTCILSRKSSGRSSSMI